MTATVQLYRAITTLDKGAIAGPAANLVTAYFVMTVMCLNGLTQPDWPNVLGPVADTTVAWTSGLREGDVVTKVDGTAVTTWHDIEVAAEARAEGAAMHFQVTRRDTALAFTVPAPQVKRALGDLMPQPSLPVVGAVLMLEVVGLAGFQNRYPNQLSGGQRQRMALARAMAVDPEVLLLDEPFGALDAKVREDLRAWLRRLHDEVHVTTVLVTHDQEEALDVADRIAVLNAGRIEQVGSPDELYEQPANPFVMSFLGSVSRLNGEIARPHDLRIERDRQVAITEAERTGVRVTEARVERLVRLGFEVRIELSHTTTGDQFFAQLTRAEASGLALTVGDVVWVLPTHTLGTGLPALAGEEEFPALAV